MQAPLSPRHLERLPDARRRAGNPSKSTFHDLVRRGLLPPPVRLSPRCSAWVAEEIDAVNSARIAGRADDDVRALVRSLVAGRAELAP
jgi:prophage regulatory protein